LKCIDIPLSTGLCADSLGELTAFTEAERKDGSGSIGDGSNEEGRKERRTREIIGAFPTILRTVVIVSSKPRCHNGHWRGRLKVDHKSI